MKGLENETDAARAQGGARRLVESDDVEGLRADGDSAAVGGIESGDAVQQGAFADA